MADDDFDPTTYKTGKSSSGTVSGNDWIYGFGKSALESLPELIGYTPSTSTLQFRQDYPISGLASELLGTAVPYAGWLKGIKYIPKLGKAAELAGNLFNNPIAKGAAMTAAELAPFEAGRVGISQIPGIGGDKSFSEMLGDASLNLAVGSGAGGLIHGLASAGVRPKAVTDIFPGVGIHMPYSLQARQMQEIIDKGTFAANPDTQADAMRFLSEARKRARIEELSSFEKYIAPIAHDALPGAETGKLENLLNNNLFKVPEELDYEKGTTHVRKFAKGENKDFPDADSWQAIAKQAHLPPNFEQEGQYFRYVSFNEAAGEERAANSATRINNTLTRNMSKIDDKSFITREADDGMYVVAKKIFGDVDAADTSDGWVLFKTDQPGKFFAENQRWANAQVDMTKWTPGANMAADGGEIYNAAKTGLKEYPLSLVKDFMQPKAGIGAAFGKVGDYAQKVLPQNIVGAKDNELFKRWQELWREYFAPRQFQFNKSARANWMMGQTKLVFDSAGQVVNELMNGQIKAEAGKNLFFQQFKVDPSASTLGFNPIRDMPEDLRNNWIEYFNKVIKARLDPAQMAQMVQSGEMSRDAETWFLNLHDASTWMENQFNKAESAVGKHKVTEFTPNTYGWNRRWEGDTRIIINDASDKPVALASGPNRKAAQANARELLKQNPTWNIEGEYSLSALRGEGKKLPKGVDELLKMSDWQLDKLGIRGFAGDTKAPTTKEFLTQLEDGLKDKAKNQASMTIDDALSPSRDKLASEDPTAFRMFNARLNDYKGIQSPFSQWQNNLVDKVLGPVMGPNSASKLVQYTNTALFNFQLGALRLAYPIVNALQFVQTVNPEVAFILGKAPSEALARDYDHFAVGGTKGVAGGMAVLSPLRLMAKSVNEMRRPSEELIQLFQRASNERLIEPKVVEDYIGESATKVMDIKKLLGPQRGEFNMVEWLRGLSEWMPAFSERISRTHAFTTGYIIARDYLERGGVKLSPEQMYQFARQFTEKTMYGYTAADKPRVFTTPAGSLMGLFKNWMFNYIGQMGQYTDQAFMHNNWAPLMWQTGGTFALGGLSATPLAFAADKASQWFTNKSALEMGYEQFGAGGDAVMLGLPAALTGISLYSNVNSPISNPIRDAASLFSVAAWDRAKQIGNLAGAVFDQWQVSGQHPGFDPKVKELLMRSFAPATVYRSMGAFSNPEQITQLGTGRPLIKDVTPFHQALYALGFNPTELDRGMAISQELYAKKERMKGMVAKLGEAWADAETRGDNGQMALIIRQSMVWGVDSGAVIKSGMKRLGNMRKDMVERQLTPRNMGAIQAALARQRGQEEREVTPSGGKKGIVGREPEEEE